MTNPWTPVFTTLDTFEITGRGTVHMVRVPDDLLADADSRGMRDREVVLDGHRVVVRGVEAPATWWRPGSKAFRYVGLLVEDVDA